MKKGVLPIRLSKEGLFFVAGKLCFMRELLNVQFDGEASSPVGVDEALSQLEEALEVLFRLIKAQAGWDEEFTLYVKDTYGVEINIRFSVPVEDQSLTQEPHLTIVSDDEKK